MTQLEILLHPNIPKPLHGISPRVVLGEAWWDIARQKAYLAADFHCEACGVAKRDARYHNWLEAHEFYEYDYARGRLKLLRLTALCHACHNFIHDGRMRMLVLRGEMTQEKYTEIMLHGKAILQRAGLLAKWEQRHSNMSFALWRDWRMEINGKLYGPSSASYEDWESGAWRSWRPN